jgi:hypothetical protein
LKRCASGLRAFLIIDEADSLLRDRLARLAVPEDDTEDNRGRREAAASESGTPIGELDESDIVASADDEFLCSEALALWALIRFGSSCSGVRVTELAGAEIKEFERLEDAKKCDVDDSRGALEKWESARRPVEWTSAVDRR